MGRSYDVGGGWEAPSPAVSRQVVLGTRGSSLRLLFWVSVFRLTATFILNLSLYAPTQRSTHYTPWSTQEILGPKELPRDLDAPPSSPSSRPSLTGEGGVSRSRPPGGVNRQDIKPETVVQRRSPTFSLPFSQTFL